MVTPPSCWEPPHYAMYWVPSTWQRYCLRGGAVSSYIFTIVHWFREQIAHWMETILDEATDPWGVKVERVEMYVEQFRV